MLIKSKLFLWKREVMGGWWWRLTLFKRLYNLERRSFTIIFSVIQITRFEDFIELGGLSRASAAFLEHTKLFGAYSDFCPCLFIHNYVLYLTLFYQNIWGPMAWFQGDLIGVLSFLYQTSLIVCWAAVIVVHFGQRWEQKFSLKGIDPQKCKFCP